MGHGVPGGHYSGVRESESPEEPRGGIGQMSSQVASVYQAAIFSVFVKVLGGIGHICSPLDLVYQEGIKGWCFSVGITRWRTFALFVAGSSW